MIKLDCPGCDKGLEIDEGFAGGICRCYDCGTLMTVPEAGSSGHAERLERAGRPASPGGRPDAPGRRPDSPTNEAGTFVTATGKKIDVTEEQLRHVEVAKKARMGVRFAVIGIFAGFVVGMIVLLVILGGNMLREADKERAANNPKNIGPDVVGTDVIETLFTYDPTANPYFIEEPNLFGKPVASEPDQITAVIVDTSAAMRQQLDFVKEVLPINIKAIGGARQMKVYFATEGGVRAFPDQPTLASSWDGLAFKGWLSEIQAGGAPSLAEAVEQGLADSPARIALIVSLAPVSFEMDKIAGMVEDKSVAVDVIQVGRFDQAMQEFAEKHDGKYIELPEGQIETWYLDYLDRRK